MNAKHDSGGSMQKATHGAQCNTVRAGRRRRVPSRLLATPERLEPRALMAVGVAGPLLAPLPTQSLDGTGNNVAHPEWGSTDEQLLRRSVAAYGDGISSPSGADRPSARVVSNLVAASPEGGITNDRDYTAMAYAWGQFLDHDIGLTDSATPRERLAITVPTGDPWFDPAGTGAMTIPMSRSSWDAATGTSVSNPRQQLNRITAFIDGSQVYGSDATRAAALREFLGGRMKTSAGDLLPFNTAGLANANDAHVVADSQLFLAGDVRANENPELASLQTLFVREHNRIAAAAALRNPGWSDEQLFQHARRMVIAELQQITYNEFLPALLGANTPATAALRAYRGYRDEVNPGIATEFSTAGFRVGHSMLGSDIQFLDDNGRPVRDEMRLKDAFFDPRPVSEVGIDPLLKYLASDRAQEIDTKAVDDVRNFLFGAPGQGGFDLVALNIQRGRDHGLADYNTVRMAYGLPRVTSFAEITPDASVRQALEQAYGSVDTIDLWVGGLAEKHLPGSSVGPTFTKIIVDQFMRLRDGDRYWYQNVLPDAAVRTIQATTLADVIRRNTSVRNLQPDVFLFRTSVGGVVFGDRNGDGVRQSSESGLAAAVVTLVDATGATVARTRTDGRGAFSFDRLNLGSYRVVVTPAGGGASTTSRPVVITKGGEIRGLDVGLAVAPPPTPRPPAAPKPPGTLAGNRPGAPAPRAAAFAAIAAAFPSASSAVTPTTPTRR
ncbi:MAG: peroxidase family protein [Planctomycetia bacterium]